jgi:hypothetical protein
MGRGWIGKQMSLMYCRLTKSTLFHAKEVINMYINLTVLKHLDVNNFKLLSTYPDPATLSSSGCAMLTHCVI